MNWHYRNRRTPLRRCLDCGGDCYGWSESTRCPACWKARRPLGALGLQPGGVAEAARIDEDGYFFEPDGNPVGVWTSDRALDMLGLIRDETMTMPLFEGKCFGLDFRDRTAVAWFEEFFRLASEGAFAGSLTNDNGEVSSDPRCRGHRGDISVGSPLLDSFGMRMQPDKRVWFPSNGDAPDHIVVYAEGM